MLVSLVVVNVALVALVFTDGAAEKEISLNYLSWVPTRILAIVTTASLMAALTALLPILKSYRRICSVITGNEEWTSVRVMALGVVVAISLLLFVPLLALGEAPLLALIKKDSPVVAEVLDEARDSASILRGEMYSLTWSLLAATLAVGFGVRRNWRECLERLGLIRLSLRQIGLALGLTALVFILSEGVDLALSHFWSLYAWPTTEGKACEDMFKAFSSPVGAIVFGVVAGFGEEVLVRGMLQPRLGLLLSNLFFTATHAYQYNWDSLLWVFVFGLALGLIRKRTSTSVCVIVHGGFDFVVMMIDVLTK